MISLYNNKTKWQFGLLKSIFRVKI
jgi:hypothetical protein